ncbi:GNAT family N-acetyltransferase [Fodinicola feengrottensis]
MSITGTVVRRAGPADAAALVSLRALMFQEMGSDIGDPDAAWLVSAERWFADRLGKPDEFAAFVVDDPVDGVICCAAGICDSHAPTPKNLSGLHGTVFNVSTDSRHRRRGHARGCLTALLSWFQDETEVQVVNLNATGDGIGLYESLGFVPPRFPALAIRLT